MNHQIEYYTYGLLIYIPAAAVLAYIISSFSPKKSQPPTKRPKKVQNIQEAQVNIQSQQAPKKPQTTQEKPNQKPQKPKKKKQIIPDGKIAYCKYCEKYLTSDEFLLTHGEGKKHQKNFEGRDGIWYKFVDPSEAEKSEDKDVGLKLNVQAEIEDGWTPITKVSRKKKH
ncbi:unnamed protein product [Blepharisma stoltei]|uniref:Matrin-type domain-containing protein n=1 Tax=Blepharisma stoltei TaxID=1481888 RepID=A0AAU9KIV9_9CILI|nr:unnamed protein product [Blepharisma stoltei]